MKKVIFGLFISSMALVSCEKHDKDHENEIENVTLDVTLNATDTYTLDLTKYGDEDDISKIETQATEYLESVINKVNTSNDFGDVYTFKPSPTSIKLQSGYKDKVVLKVYEPAGRKHYEECNITINFTIN